MDGRCSENIELSQAGGIGVTAEELLVFQMLAEGLQLALGEEVVHG